MLYLNKYLWRKKSKVIPQLLIIVLITFFASFFYSFTKVIESQKLQLFNQYQKMTLLNIEAGVTDEQISLVQDYFKDYRTYPIRVLRQVEKLIFGTGIVEIYNFATVGDIKDFYQKRYEQELSLPADSAPFLILTKPLYSSLQRFREGEKLIIKDRPIPIKGLLDEENSKFGIALGLKEGKDGLLILEALSANMITACQAIFPFVEDVESYHKHLLTLEQDLSFINDIYLVINIIVYLIFLTILVLAIYFSFKQRIGEIAIFNILGVTKLKIAGKFIYELLILNLLGLTGGYFLAFIVWELLMKQSLAGMGSYLSIVIPLPLFLILGSTIFILLLIIVKKINLLEAVDVINKNVENKIL